ncbi:hypothetical protein N7504_010497 [Penicillium tannophilum]|nr:hypothetical protein N7504_010497 [Penicillium tannophilum]
MAQTLSPGEAAGAWNPASLPESGFTTTATEAASSDNLVADNAQKPPQSSLKSPLSDDDYSAWDMPEDTPAAQPQPTSLDSVLADVHPTPDDTVDDVSPPFFDHADDASATVTPDAHFEPSTDHSQTAQSEPSEPEPPTTAESPEVESTGPDAIFASNEDSVDFSELLTKEPVVEEPLDQPQDPEAEAASEFAPVETLPVEAPLVESQPAAEAPTEHPQSETTPAESSSIAAVFESSEGPDDFSALLSANTESTPIQPDADPAETIVASSEAAQEVTQSFPVDSWSAPPSTEQEAPSSEEDNQFQDKMIVDESEQSTAPMEVTFDTPVADLSADSNGVWANQADGELDSDGDDFFNQLKTQTKPIFAPEAESRFEEGVPLLEEDSQAFPEHAGHDDNVTNDLFANDNDDAEDFFSSVKPSGANAEPFHLTRKSTTQVLESVGIDLSSPTSDVSAAAQFEDVIKAATSEPQELQAQASVPAPSEDDLAARWEAELSDAEEDDLAARWEAALDLDDDMEEDLTGPTQNVPQSPMAIGLNSPFETPQQRQTPPRLIPGIHAPHQPSTADLVGGVDFPGAPPTNASIPSYFTHQPHPVTSRGESFAERSKEGYKSPYDLPDDLSVPRRPVLTHKPTPPKVDNSMPPPPPPGSNTMQRSTPYAAPPPASTAAAGSVAAAPPPAPKNFFEELPLPPPRSRPASSGRYTPGPTGPAMAGTSVGARSQSPYAPLPATAPAPPTASTGALSLQPSLQPPELLDPYGPVGTLASSAPAGPPAASRYSPMPPSLQHAGKPSSGPRYSPAPPPSSAGRNRYASQPLGVPGQGANLPFQPRTSSPLAYHEKVSYQPDGAQQQQLPPLQPPSLQPSVDLSPPRQRHSIDQGSPYAPQLPNGSTDSANQGAGSPPGGPQQKGRYAPQEYMNQFTQRMAPNNTYAPTPAPAAADVQPYAQPSEPGVVSPRRSQTQSPGQQLTSPRAFVPSLDTLPRPASVHGSSSPTKIANPYAPQQAAASRARAVSRASQQLDFIAPTDGQEQDPLQRWKGAPIFKFGFGGAVVSCFPKHIPRYSAGVATPMIKPTLGEPRHSQLDAWLPTGETIVPHPGPLKAKSKKKDVLAWLSSKIAAFENEETPGFNPQQPDVQKRHEEKILLWKVTKVLVESDGTFEGSPEAQKSLRQAIFPNLADSQPEGSYGNSFSTPGGSGAFGLPSQPDAVDAQWGEELRNHLLLGEREKAVWAAVDRRLWGHAMVIASTMEKTIWKQVVQEFVRREVRSGGGNTESIAALYEIFAGNVEESIDELVPPSARAGHHLISKADGQGASRNALDGLESWRDTLGLVLSNRSSEDHQALLALGNLLASYGRTEAAHICFIFSRGAVFGGPDDPQANIVLLGADHQRLPCSLLDDDSILLTEIYEFATSMLSNSPAANLPHLLAFKLMHAKYLADRGRKTEAQNYCDAFATSLKATTRPSPYHHQQLFTEIDELSARLRQAASDGASSWISKPSMEKVSGSMWARFNSFVVGDDNDAASTGSGKAGETSDFGPFANVAGTPTVSRSPSVSDLYGSYPGAGAQQIPPAAIPTAGSRYLPSNQYAANGSPEHLRGRSSMDSQRSVSGGLSFGQRRLSQEPETPVDSMFPGAPMYGSPGNVAYQPTPPQQSYMPLAPVKEDATQSPADATQPQVNGLFYKPPGQENSSDSQSPYYQGPPGMPQAENSGYMPPAAPDSYEPPSYAPVMNLAPEEIDPQEEEESKPKKSFMDGDDDDDLAARVANLKISQKEENDRKADEAFRKAAEEDAKRGEQQAQKKGWFGGWFGGAAKKDADSSGGGPIKAKLGEESSFYYDNDLKKWVNKKDPNSSASVRATPPPPRSSAPPSRTSSGSMPPPPAPMSAASGSRPQSSSSDAANLSSSPAFPGLAVPPPMPRSVSTSGAISSTPPRPTSSLSHAQSIDDLLGAPSARKGANTVRGKKKGRYVDVMAQ